MYPILFEIFGRQIGTFGLSAILGVAAAWFLVRFLMDEKDKDIPNIFLICICGGMIGAFLLRPITRIPAIITNWEYLRQMPMGAVLSLIFGELVFYGGLIGGVIAMLLYCRGFKIPILPIADLFAPAVALAHGFGRIGCFLGGCCYGVSVNREHPFAVIFPVESATAPSGVPLLAIQLIEAICLFVIATILTIVYKKVMGKQKKMAENGYTQPRFGLVVCLYGLLYSIVRFILEFYRGDQARGVYGVLSTSQYISIALFIFSTTLLIHILTRKQRPNEIE